MPTYEYKCPNCGTFERNQKITAEPLAVCPTCGSAVERLISPVAFHLKGTGWYKTDYASSSVGSAETTKSKVKDPEVKEEVKEKKDTKDAASESSSAASETSE